MIVENWLFPRKAIMSLKPKPAFLLVVYHYGVVCNWVAAATASHAFLFREMEASEKGGQVNSAMPSEVLVWHTLRRQTKKKMSLRRKYVRS